MANPPREVIPSPFSPLHTRMEVFFVTYMVCLAVFFTHLVKDFAVNPILS